jgi:hypothetical protein
VASTRTERPSFEAIGAATAAISGSAASARRVAPAWAAGAMTFSADAAPGPVTFAAASKPTRVSSVLANCRSAHYWECRSRAG